METNRVDASVVDLIGEEHLRAARSARAQRPLRPAASTAALLAGLDDGYRDERAQLFWEASIVNRLQAPEWRAAGPGSKPQNRAKVAGLQAPAWREEAARRVRELVRRSGDDPNVVLLHEWLTDRVRSSVGLAVRFAGISKGLIWQPSCQVFEGIGLLLQDQLGEARKLLLELCSDPNAAISQCCHENLGTLEVRAGNLAEASRFYELAAEHESPPAETMAAWVLVSCCLHDSGAAARALRALNRSTNTSGSRARVDPRLRSRIRSDQTARRELERLLPGADDQLRGWIDEL